MNDFKEKLGMRESGGRYDAKNSLGYLGKYQFGKMALIDAGYIDNKGNWTGKDGVDSEESFLKNKNAQENAMDNYTKLNRKYLKNYGANEYIGKDFEGIPITESGLTAAAHLIGARGISDMLKSGKVKKDGYGTPATEYLDKFKDYNLDDKGDRMNKLKKLEEMKNQIKVPMRPEKKDSLSEALGFQDGGLKRDKSNEIISALMEGLNSEEADNIPMRPADQVENEEDFQPRIPANNISKEEQKENVAEVIEDKIEEPRKRSGGVSESEADSDMFNTEVDTDDVPNTMKELYKRYEDARKQYESDQDQAQWATALSSIASTLDKYSPSPKGIQARKYSAPAQTKDRKEMIDLARLQGIGQDGLITPYQRKALELQRRRLELQEGKEGRLGRKDELQREVKNRLSDKEVKDITALDDGMRILDEVEGLLKQTDVKEDLGPYASTIEEGSRYVPFMERDEDFVKMQQLVGIQLADYVKSISGAQVSEEEAQRLLKNIPNMGDKPGEFQTKLQTFRKELGEAKDDYIENIGKQKSGAEKFKKSPKKTQANEVRRKTKDGRIAVFNKDTKEFIRYED